MLCVQDDTTFTLLINVSYPSTDPKKLTSGSFTARFKDHDADVLEEFSGRIVGMPDEEALDFILDEGDAIGQIGDKQGTLLPGPEQRAYVYRRLPLRKACVKAYFDAVGGVQKGNSLLSRGR